MTRGIATCALCLRGTVQVVSRTHLDLASANAVPRQLTASGGSQTLRRYASTANAAGSSNPVIGKTIPKASTTAPRSLDLGDGLQDSVAQKKDRERLGRIVKKQLAHMDDPWHIAQQVGKVLAKDRFEEALLLTQTASSERQVVVSWNHLIDYKMKKQQIKDAVKLYNDMKKRAQLPNVQTYALIFRGCANSQHSKLAVDVAIKHYNILLKDQRIQPNTKHLNSVLNVCAKARDVDSMFLMADTINDSTRAPDAFTYSTIMHALRNNTMGDRESTDLSQKQREALVDRTIQRAKGLWMEVLDKWKHGRLAVDESLVCAMGRVLLMSFDTKVKREIFDLVEQTMNVPNMSNGATPASEKELPDGDEPPPTLELSAKGTFAKPGSNTLAMLVQLCASARLPAIGLKYWNLLLRDYNVVPDRDIWLRMLGMLKVGKSSGQAASLVELLPDEYVEAKTFKIAMETCLRDNVNPSAPANADRVLDSMARRLPGSEPDMHVLRMYLRVALLSNRLFRATAEASGEIEEPKRLYGEQISRALSRLWVPYGQLHKIYLAKDAHPRGSGKDKRANGQFYNKQREVNALARLMSSAYSKIIDEAMLPASQLRELQPLGAKINRSITDFFSRREAHEPNLPSALDKANKDKEEDGDKQEQPLEVDADEAARSWETVTDPMGAFVWDTARDAKIKGKETNRSQPWKARRNSRGETVV